MAQPLSHPDHRPPNNWLQDLLTEHLPTVTDSSARRVTSLPLLHRLAASEKRVNAGVPETTGLGTHRAAQEHASLNSSRISVPLCSVSQWS